MSMTWITFKCQSFQLQVSKLIVTVIHYSVFFYYCKHIGYVFIVSLNVSTQYQHLVFFYKRATMHGKWRVIYRPIFILSLLYRYSCPSVLSILYQLMSEPPPGHTHYSTSTPYSAPWPLRLFWKKLQKYKNIVRTQIFLTVLTVIFRPLCFQYVHIIPVLGTKRSTLNPVTY